VATIQIFYILRIQKRILSAETIWGDIETSKALESVDRLQE
jgi:hypothetical protein